MSQDNQTTVPETEVIETTVVPTAEAQPTTAKSFKATPKAVVATAMTHADVVSRFNNKDVNRQYLISTMEDYISAMTPGKIIGDKAGAAHQLRLWTMIKNLINKDQPFEEFKTAWNVIISYFREYGHERKVLGMRYVNRFFHEWSGTEEESFAYQQLLGLLHISIDENRERFGRNLKLINLDKMFAAGNIYTEEGRQRIFQYYRV